MDQELIAYFDARFRALHEESAGLRGDIRHLAEVFLSVGLSLEHLRGEYKLQLEAMQELLRPALARLDRRVQKLESWRETKERDPMDIIRERYGRKSEQ